MKKRMISFLLTGAMLAATVCGCGKQEPQTASQDTATQEDAGAQEKEPEKPYRKLKMRRKRIQEKVQASSRENSRFPKSRLPSGSWCLFPPLRPSRWQSWT